ncbi:MAG: peptidase T [Sphingobacteriia bacterium]|nr:MAG: peptidase T [Sphingobacteriia bacterium]
MLLNYPYSVTDRLMRYVQIDTQSDPHSSLHPSTPKQKVLSNLLAAELKEIGVVDVLTDEFGYVYGTIPATSSKKMPVICFCSHIDTAPDCSGTNVKPILHSKYDGLPIILPDDVSQIISVDQYPYLKNHIGKDIITASGNTLLGADDKAGVAIIMDFAQYLISHPEILHGTIKILFTPDEEIGEGTVKLNLEQLGANFAYTLDGGKLGSFEEETFSADGVTLQIEGIIAHPGDAKNKMVNAIKIASEIVDQLPKEKLSPESTETRQGFIHPLRIEGLAEKASIDFLIRDFETSQLQKHESLLQSIAEKVIAKYKGASYTFKVVEQYRNMKEILDQFPFTVSYAEEAYRRIGLPFIKEPIRGGTDGSRLSFMGLPCPNIFTGMQAIHSKHEWIGVEDMQFAVEALVELVKVWEERS